MSGLKDQASSQGQAPRLRDDAAASAAPLPSFSPPRGGAPRPPPRDRDQHLEHPNRPRNGPRYRRFTADTQFLVACEEIPKKRNWTLTPHLQTLFEINHLEYNNDIRFVLFDLGFTKRQQSPLSIV